MSDYELDFEALAALADPQMVQALEEPLEKLNKEVDILLFISQGCPACPHQVKTLATLTLASPLIAAEIVDIGQEPELAQQYQVTAVPTTVVDDELVVVGVKHPVQMAEILLAREGPEGEVALLTSFLETGRREEAADRILYGPAPGATLQAFLELWAKSTLQDRMGLTLLAEAVLDQNPEGLDPLLPALLTGLQTESPLTEDPSRKGDTADLLGRIGHPDARPVLEMLTEDENPEVAETAAEALEELEEMD
jgi:glutaredoxin